MTPEHVAVIDIGKTNAKLALVDAADLSEMAVVTRANTVIEGPPYPHFDVEGIWGFLLDGLAEFHRKHRIDAISVTTHGACAALIAADGSVATPILDYEHTGPDTLAESYDTIRPSFRETGSPRLPMGLNLGAQLHWQLQQDSGLIDRTASIVTYPQYWGYRLTGALASDVSSLGCHTDLWNAFEARFSSLVESLGIADKMAPARKAGDVLGTLLPDVAARTGLPATTPVLTGIHDSNASLLPHVMRREPPFSVVSTGTWVIAMTVGGAKPVLDPARDTLVNVNALGGPVPSARFMGGREYEVIRAAHDAPTNTTPCPIPDLPMLMPAVVPESGPFQKCQHRWIGAEPAPGSAERFTSLSFYLALVTAECLSLTGHAGPVVVEGPFGTNADYCAMLSAATQCPVEAAAGGTGTSQGAAMLALPPEAFKSGPKGKTYAPEDRTECAAYAKRWRKALG